jgi:hypothetical protein
MSSGCARDQWLWRKSKKVRFDAGSMHCVHKALALLVLLFAASNAAAQNLEPRSYVNTPVGMHF